MKDKKEDKKEKFNFGKKFEKKDDKAKDSCDKDMGSKKDESFVLNPIPTFLQWCEENEFELPVFEAPAEEDTTAEQRSRTGAKEGLYPELYYSGQYPSLWKIPKAADSAYYQSINKK